MSTKAKRKSLADKLGLKVPPSRVKRFLNVKANGTIGSEAPIYLAGVIEYLLAEVLEIAGSLALASRSAKSDKGKRITPRFINLAIRNDEDLNKLLNRATVNEGGVLPNIHSRLVPESGEGGGSRTPKKTKKKTGK